MFSAVRRVKKQEIMLKTKKQWNIVLDMGLNICAVSAPIAVLQLAVYPYLAADMESEAYGFMLTMYSVWMAVSNSFGNVLNNIRLLRAKEYADMHLIGDFKPILYQWLLLNGMIIAAVTIYYLQEFQSGALFFSIFISSMILLKSYAEVGFRIKLDYRAVLACSLLQSLGFTAGAAAFRFTRIWQFVFLFGFLFSLSFTLWKSCVTKEQCVKTELYKKTKRDSNLLAVATFSSSMMSYADKLVLYPLMGGHMVSVYYTATILGKIISMLSGPVSSVVLSYISKWENGRKKIFAKVLASGGILAVIGYVITICVSRTVVSLLFPQWAEEVMLYLPITTIAIVIQTLNSFLSPFILKFYEIKWQIVINLSSLFLYLSGSLLLWHMWGMTGFCVGTVIGQLSKTVIMVGLYGFDSRKCSKIISLKQIAKKILSWH